MCCSEAKRLGGRLYDCDGGFVLRGVVGGVGLCFAVWPMGRSLLRGVASGVGLLWVVVVAGLTEVGHDHLAVDFLDGVLESQQSSINVHECHKPILFAPPRDLVIDHIPILHWTIQREEKAEGCRVGGGAEFEHKELALCGVTVGDASDGVKDIDVVKDGDFEDLEELVFGEALEEFAGIFWGEFWDDDVWGII
uniref:Uncharacterized protein n=1 Tax=Fagus sylvatica TaxID=28930 RepID=A0A2N9H1Q2_FAGSY